MCQAVTNALDTALATNPKYITPLNTIP
jgi:hypothetical protein